MYDPSALTSSAQPSSFTGPSQWTPSTTYRPGNIVWFAGTFWRCECGHTSAQGAGGAVSGFSFTITLFHKQYGSYFLLPCAWKITGIPPKRVIDDDIPTLFLVLTTMCSLQTHYTFGHRYLRMDTFHRTNRSSNSNISSSSSNQRPISCHLDHTTCPRNHPPRR